MQRKELTSDEIAFQPIVNTYQRDNVVGIRISVLHVSPSVQIDVFPSKVVIVRDDTFIHEQNGSTRYRWGGRKLLVDARSEDSSSRLLANQEGQVIFLHNPNHPIDSDQVSVLTGNQYSKDDLAFTERFSQLDINYPGSFEQLTFGEVVRFFRQEYDLTQRELASLSRYETGTINRIESGKIQSSLNSIINHVLWEKNDPRYEIVRRAWAKSRGKN